MSETATITASLAGPATVTRTIAIPYTATTGRQRVPLTGAQTYTFDLAMMPAEGLRGLLVEVEPLDANGTAITAAISVHWTSNSVAKSEELTADPVRGLIGVLLIGSPAAAHGVTALSIVTTANAVVYVTALG